ncbi:MAG TPA: cytochrome c [Castellaniella sp.]|uniref:c-type cytochrome n=1 Tax=Castellaniella sp. TaxID=1955812 RepID=UPI002F23BC6B
MARAYPLIVAAIFSLVAVNAQGQDIAPTAAARQAEPIVAANSTPAYQYSSALGQSLYENTCMACHGEAGTGVPGSFPPLQGNPVVLNPDPTQQIKTVLFGVNGHITVNGTEYNGFMPPMGSGLSDTDIANLINYERSSWGNNGKHITPEQVTALRPRS